MKTEQQIKDKISFIERNKDTLNESEWPKPSFILTDILKWVLDG